MLKRALDWVVTAATVVAAFSVLYMVAARTGVLPAGASASRAQRAAGYSPGDVLRAVQFTDSERTLLILFRTKCAYCIRSVPFYQSLVQLRDERKAKTKIYALAAGSDPDAIDFPSLHGWAPDRVVLVEKGQLSVMGVPTILVVDPTGKVVGVWLGELSDTEQRDVVRLALGQTV